MSNKGVRPYDVRVGDHILGLPGFEVSEVHYQATGVLDGEAVNSEVIYGPAGAWQITFTNGQSLVYGADRKVSILRADVGELP